MKRHKSPFAQPLPQVIKRMEKQLWLARLEKDFIEAKIQLAKWLHTFGDYSKYISPIIKSAIEKGVDKTVRAIERDFAKDDQKINTAQVRKYIESVHTYARWIEERRKK